MEQTTQEKSGAARKLPFFSKKGKNAKKSFKREALTFNYLCMIIPVLQWLITWLYVNWQTIMLAFKSPVDDSWNFKINFQWLWLFQLNVDPTSSAYDGSLLMAIKNTMMFFGIEILFTLPLSVVIAYFIYKKIVGYKVFRIAFYLPAVLPAIVMTSVYVDVTQSGGVIDQLFGHVPKAGLLGDPSTALGAVIVFVLLCSFTTNVLLFSGGMARVPLEVLEAAKIDGCGPFREIVSLIVPLVWPTLTTQIVLAFTGMFNGGGPVMMLSGGQHGTMTISYWLFYAIAGTGRTAIPDGSAGVYHVSAVGLLLTIIAVPTVLLVRHIFNKVEAIEY
ncbi:MAG: sugar ABC transporter permease [Clostridia bacterium]|nr:sugar ABC transporter permease [Clostridia bacterium]